MQCRIACRWIGAAEVTKMFYSVLSVSLTHLQLKSAFKDALFCRSGRTALVGPPRAAWTECCRVSFCVPCRSEMGARIGLDILM